MILEHCKVNSHSKNTICFSLFYVATLEMQTKNVSTESKQLPIIYTRTQLGTHLVTPRVDELGCSSGLTGVTPELCGGEKREHHEQRDWDGPLETSGQSAKGTLS